MHIRNADSGSSRTVTIIGVACILWAISLGYSALRLGLPKVLPMATSPSFPMPHWVAFLIMIVAVSLIPAALAVCAVALLRGTAWARHRLFQVVALVGIGALGSLATWGFRIPLGRSAIDLGIAIILLLVLVRPAVRDRFPYCKTLKRTVIFAGILTAAIVGSSVAMWFYCDGYRVPILKRVAFEPVSDAVARDSLEWTDVPLGYDIALPRGFKLALLSEPDSLTGIAMAFEMPDYYVYMQEVRLWGRGLPGPYLRELGWNPYRFYRAALTERFGVIFTVMKGIWVLGSKRIAEVEVNGLNCFVIWWPFRDSDETRWFEYYIFEDGEFIGSVMAILKRPTPGRAEGLFKRIVMTTRRRTKPVKSSEEYFRVGRELVAQGNLRSAELAFANSLMLDWNNAEGHYQLALAQFGTDDLCWAREHAEEAIRLRPDFDDARALLAEIEKADAEHQAEVPPGEGGEELHDWVRSRGLRESDSRGPQ